MRPFDEQDARAVTALRVLAIDQVEQARSGHPGLPLGAAPMAYALWSRFLRFDPQAPGWPNRDRFVLSAGHGSALLYSLIHLFGYDLPLAELRAFRQWGSRTPGHPEHSLTPGVETTTGPLGQGLATAVGMALAERHLAARFNRSGHPLFDHRTFVIASDGDLMEGISHEAASLAGHLKLGRLVVLFDDNHITIDGPTELACSDDVAGRFAAYGWRVLHVDDGNDLEAIAGALARATAGEDAPVLIRVRTHIGYGAPHKQDTAAVHGAPLGAEEWAATRTALGWTIDEPFVVPDDLRAHFHDLTRWGHEAHAAWEEHLEGYRRAFPDAAAELERRLRRELPAGWESLAPAFGDAEVMATRSASGAMLNALAPHLGELIGGSADLAPSNNTLLETEDAVAPGELAGRNLHFGVREHAMAAICNGASLHGALRPYCATFLVFSDYMRPAVRLAALMGQPVVFVFTHDSIGLGEDGPTHQPVEHLVALRLIPGLVVLRPADAHETVAAWRVAIARRDGPTALVLSRQKLPVLDPPPADGVARGAYVRAEASGGCPEVVLLATGSEVALALAARDRLEADGTPTRVVSMPSHELLEQQDDAYVREVLGPGGALRVAVEAGRGHGWHRWIGDGELIVLDRFGASAPGGEVMERLGFSVEAVVARVRAALDRRRPAAPVATLPRHLAAGHEAAVRRLEESGAWAALAARDASAWGERHAAAVARRLGWLDLPRRTAGELPALRRLVADLTADGARALYLLGMGGSSLAPRVLRRILGAPSGRELVVLDTTDPERVGDVLDNLDPATAAVVAVSKSGTTAETSALLALLWESIASRLADPQARCLAVTEPGTPLAALAAERGFRAVLPHPVDVGGRYSALSVVGMLPAAWLGHDVDQLLRSGAAGLAGWQAAAPIACALAAVAEEGRARLAWCASPRLAPLGAWVEQLVAESTGKEGRGVLPVVLSGPPSTPPWPATLYLSPRLSGEDTTTLDAALDGVAAAAPVLRWELPAGGLGQAFTVLELATALTGLLLGVNPFDEPDVVAAKERAREALADAATTAPATDPDPAAALAEHCAGVGAGGAVVLLAYLPERPEIDERLQGLADAVAAATGAPSTAAFGPRYLHSTGQLHKGGGGEIVPVVLTSDPARDLPIPGRDFTLGRLRLAQALGDVAALRDAGRSVLHLHLGDHPAAALEAMSAALAR